MKGIEIDTSLPLWFYVYAAAWLFLIGVVVWGIVDLFRWSIGRLREVFRQSGK